MLSQLLIAWSLMALCVTVHSFGLTLAFHWLRSQPATAELSFWRTTWLLIRVAGWTLLLHLVEIVFWAACYVWTGSMPDAQTAGYFSAVTYTTTGYGDVVLPPAWRLVGGVEALTGILMCGWSTGFFFAVVTRLYRGPFDKIGPPVAPGPADQ